MSETASPAPEAAAAASTPAQPSAPASSGSTEPAGGGAPPKSESQPKAVAETEPAPGEVSAIEAAMQRARQKLAPAGDAPTNSEDEAGQAAGDGGSTPVEPEAKAAKESDAAAGDGPDTPAGDSTAIKAPEDWPQGLRDTFDALPDPAKDGMLGVYKQLQAGFTKATQQLKSARDALPAEAQRLMQVADAFNTDPKATLKRLAQEQGLSVRFDGEPGPAAESDEIPEFESVADMARWMREQNAAQLKRELETQQQAALTASQQAEAERALRAELREAESLPDWATHREAVIGRLSSNPALTVSDAYLLETAPGLRKLAEEGHAAKQELAKLKRQLADRDKLALAPVGGGAGSAKEDAGLTPTELAYQRAQRKLAQARH